MWLPLLLLYSTEVQSLDSVWKVTSSYPNNKEVCSISVTSAGDCIEDLRNTYGSPTYFNYQTHYCYFELSNSAVVRRERWETWEATFRDNIEILDGSDTKYSIDPIFPETLAFEGLTNFKITSGGGHYLPGFKLCAIYPEKIDGYMSFPSKGCGVNRNDLGIFTETLVLCTERCTLLIDCVSFEFDNSTNKCYLSSSCTDIEAAQSSDDIVLYVKQYAYVSFASKGCVDRNELGDFTETLVQCEEKCSLLIDCVSFEFDSSTNKCQLSSSCTDIEAAVALDDITLYVKQMLIAYVLASSKVISGCDLTSHSSFSLEQCKDRCAQTEGCKGFSRDTASDLCVMKSCSTLTIDGDYNTYIAVEDNKCGSTVPSGKRFVSGINAGTVCNTACTACFENKTCGSTVPSGKQFQYNKDAETVCGTACSACFENIKCGSIVPSGKQYAYSDGADTVCGAHCDTVCFEDKECSPIPSGKQLANGNTADTVCGNDCTACFEDTKCGSTVPSGKRFASGISADTVCGSDCTGCFEDRTCSSIVPSGKQFAYNKNADTVCDTAYTACTTCFEDKTCGGIVPSGKQYANGKHGNIVCGTDCTGCFEDAVTCGTVPSGKQFQYNKDADTVCDTACWACFEDKKCGNNVPSGKQWASDRHPSYVCGAQCTECFKDSPTRSSTTTSPTTRSPTTTSPTTTSSIPTSQPTTSPIVTSADTGPTEQKVYITMAMTFDKALNDTQKIQITDKIKTIYLTKLPASVSNVMVSIQPTRRRRRHLLEGVEYTVTITITVEATAQELTTEFDRVKSELAPEYYTGDDTFQALIQADVVDTLGVTVTVSEPTVQSAGCDGISTIFDCGGSRLVPFTGIVGVLLAVRLLAL